jgi:hypothetical protein
MIASSELHVIDQPRESPQGGSYDQQPASLPLWAELERVYRRVAHQGDSGFAPPALPAVLPDSYQRRQPLARLRELFGLSDFELDIILLCAGTALDPRFLAALAAMRPAAHAPTFGLALTALEHPHWSAISRLQPLRYWRLIDLGPGTLLEAPLILDERILQFLLGVPAADERLEPAIRLLSAREDQPGAWQAALDPVAARGVLHWRRSPPGVVLLTGNDAGARTALFHAMCRAAGWRGWMLDAADLPEPAGDRERLAQAYTRESALWPAALLVKTARLENPALLQAWLSRVDAPVAVDVENGSVAERLNGLRLAAPSMNAAERKGEWQRRLGSLSAGLDAELDRVVQAFALDASEIRDTVQALDEETLLEPALAADPHALGAAAWKLCRNAARRSLDELASHVNNCSAWLDLVLPERQTAILRQIAIHARQASRVNEEWGFAERYTSGLGLSVLFSGPSGTGKTMAGGVLARELGRDLYQIDLATVVSKYIGETEKHLRRIFDAAERSGAILLFDEADALFGKRSQVRDSHDRYANLEVSYLLQRMESYRGIAILTTNMQSALDPAFQRRLRFVVQFPFPDGPSREQIWRKVFPAAAPKEALDYAKLAQLNVTGGSIRNIALLAAFLAADAGAAIAMSHVLEAARTEYAKLDKPLSPSESRGWV